MRHDGFNPTVIAENLVDLEKSEVEYFPTGRVMAIDHYVLRPGAGPLPWIFKIPETCRNTTYVNADFVARVGQEKLTGFKFVPLP